ncbi:hypothetical protein QF026_008287 [Streptomyces aurantiacus]|nr:hypothetical protein [Streptomyces aurantiacus]
MLHLVVVDLHVESAREGVEDDDVAVAHQAERALCRRLGG